MNRAQTGLAVIALALPFLGHAQDPELPAPAEPELLREMLRELTAEGEELPEEEQLEVSTEPGNSAGLPVRDAAPGEAAGIGGLPGLEVLENQMTAAEADPLETAVAIEALGDRLGVPVRRDPTVQAARRQELLNRYGDVMEKIEELERAGLGAGVMMQFANVADAEEIALLSSLFDVVDGYGPPALGAPANVEPAAMEVVDGILDTTVEEVDEILPETDASAGEIVPIAAQLESPWSDGPRAIVESGGERYALRLGEEVDIGGRAVVLAGVDIARRGAGQEVYVVIVQVDGRVERLRWPWERR